MKRSLGGSPRVALLVAPLVSLLVSGLAFGLPRSARAFNIESTLASPCHENITLAALVDAEPMSVTPLDAPDAPWWLLGGYYGRRLENREPTTGAARLVLTSAILGVRSPDIGELGLVHLHNLREVHLLDERQVSHFLRATAQDGPQGGLDAAAAGRAEILALIEASAAAYDDDPDGQRLGRVRAYVERYGQIEIEVWMPLFLLGQALHALQDSFTHTYRTDDGRRILAVQNYVEAVTSEHDELRDGPRHSDALDDCSDERLAPLVDAATLASTELVRAVQQYWRDRDIAVVQTVLGEWVAIDEGCTPANEYCGSTWAPLAKAGETFPLLGCAAGPRRRNVPVLVLIGLVGASGLARRRTRARDGRSRAPR